eukprot:3722472-Amphidinium_carterae.1
MGWNKGTRHALEEAVCTTFFRGVRNPALQSQVEASATCMVIPAVADAINSLGAHSIWPGTGTPLTGIGEFQHAVDDLSDAVASEILHKVWPCKTVSEACKKIGHPLSWLTPRDYVSKPLLGQGFMCYSTGTPQTECGRTTCLFYDGSTLRNPTQIEWQGSWAELISQRATTALTVAAITAHPCLANHFSTDQALNAFLDSGAKTGTYGQVTQGLAGNGSFRTGQVYAPISNWSVKVEILASGVPSRFTGESEARNHTSVI